MIAKSKESLKEMLTRHEGKRSKVYQDSVGVATIGVGRNVDNVGLSDEEIDFMLGNDIQRCSDELQGFSWFQKLNFNRQNAMIDMNFNLGLTRFLGFKKMIAALEIEDYEEAAIQMMDSSWSIQVGARANELSGMVRTGKRMDYV